MTVTFLPVLLFHHCVADFAADRCECQAALIAHSCPPSPAATPTQSAMEPMSPDKKIGGEREHYYFLMQGEQI